MSVFDKLAESIKKAGKNIAEEIKKRQEIAQTKKRILNRFEMRDLKDICRVYGIGEPAPYQIDILTGEKRRRTREDYVERIMEKLTLDQIKNFCYKRKIKIEDILKEESFKSTQTIEEANSPQLVEEQVFKKRQKLSEFDSILNSISKEFEPEDVRDESEFEKQLFQFLKIRYPERAKRQVNTPKGKIDIVIDDRYAIELKIADNKGKLRDLVGQLYSYKKVYDHVAVILLDVGKMGYEDIKEFIEDYEKIGVKTIILRGTLKRKNRREKKIIIKD